MYDPARAYEPDVVVVDVDERRRRPTSRPAEDLTMHVYLDGAWHRRLPDLSATACEAHILTQFAPLRREELSGDLCETCFTSGERKRAAANNRKGH